MQSNILSAKSALQLLLPLLAVMAVGLRSNAAPVCEDVFSAAPQSQAEKLPFSIEHALIIHEFNEASQWASELLQSSPTQQSKNKVVHELATLLNEALDLLVEDALTLQREGEKLDPEKKTKLTNGINALVYLINQHAAIPPKVIGGLLNIRLALELQPIKEDKQIGFVSLSSQAGPAQKIRPGFNSVGASEKLAYGRESVKVVEASVNAAKKNPIGFDLGSSASSTSDAAVQKIPMGFAIGPAAATAAERAPMKIPVGFDVVNRTPSDDSFTYSIGVDPKLGVFTLAKQN